MYVHDIVGLEMRVLNLKKKKKKFFDTLKGLVNAINFERGFEKR